MNKGKLIIFSAPSGSGKTTIVKHLLTKELNLAFSISATSRAPRHTEKDGVDYYFFDNRKFKEMVANKEFLEWEEVYEGTSYGTLKKEVERIREGGKHVLFDVDVVGGVNIKKQYGKEALAIFIQPPSVEELKKRLTLRGTDSQEGIEKRIAKAELELTYAPLFDHIIINDDLDRACAETEEIVRKFIFPAGK